MQTKVKERGVTIRRRETSGAFFPATPPFGDAISTGDEGELSMQQPLEMSTKGALAASVTTDQAE
jgi:hypothetical protein